MIIGFSKSILAVASSWESAFPTQIALVKGMKRVMIGQLPFDFISVIQIGEQLLNKQRGSLSFVILLRYSLICQKK